MVKVICKRNRFEFCWNVNNIKGSVLKVELVFLQMKGQARRETVHGDSEYANGNEYVIVILHIKIRVGESPIDSQTLSCRHCLTQLSCYSIYHNDGQHSNNGRETGTKH